MRRGGAFLDDARMPIPGARFAAALTCAAAAALAQVPAPAPTEDRAVQDQASQPPTLRRFLNRNATFHIELPPDWRQLAPNEARRLGENPAAPKELTYVEPQRFYAVGPVDAWLRGDFGGAWLWVVEQENEWLVEADFATRLADMWQQRATQEGRSQELTAIQREPVGPQARNAITALRTAGATGSEPPRRSLDVYAPSGGQQISLAFTCPVDAWADWEPQFRRWLASLTFARAAREEQTLSDRLWGPMLTGGAVGLVLLVLYKRNQRRS